MRLILMGTGPFAVPTFEWLLQSEHEILAVVTRPVPAARGRRKGPVNPVRDLFAASDIGVLAPSNVNDPRSVDQLRALHPDVLVVCDFGQLLSPQALETARLGGINLHGSLLPKYRGAAPINWALWNGDSVTGVTVIHMTPRLDGGPCLKQVPTEIAPTENAGQLEQRLAQIGIEPVAQALAMLAGWDGNSPIGEIQDPTLASKAPRLKKLDGCVDWSQPAHRICNQVRALNPWPGTYTQWHRAKGSLRLILQSVSVVDDVTVPPDAQAGQVLQCDGERLILATGLGAVAIHEVQPAGKRVLSVREFLRGYPSHVGAVPVG